jgi:hypothetical protein
MFIVYFLFIRLIQFFLDMYTNILKIMLYENKSICSYLNFFLELKTCKIK